MRKILKICENPFMHGYFHTASFMSIVTNHVRFHQSDINVSNLNWSYTDNVKTDFICEIGSKDEKIKRYYPPELSSNISYNNDGYDICFGKHDDFYSNTCYLFNTMKNLRAFSFKLNAMKEVCKWSMAGVEINEETSDYKNVFRAVFSPMSVIRIMGEKNGEVFSFEYNNDNNNKFINILFTDIIVVQVSSDGELWKDIYDTENFFDQSNSRIGFFSWIGDDSFQDWFYTNFIQLHCSKDLDFYYDVKLNYYVRGFLDYRYNMSNPWIEQFYLQRDYIDVNGGIFNFIRYNLNHNKYISLHLNEKYVPEKWAFNNTDFEHESLVYGIDDKNEILYLMGFNMTQSFEPYTISYTDFVLAYDNTIDNIKITTMSFKIPDLGFTLQASRILTFLNEYLSGINSTYRDNLIYDEIDRIFGFKIYDVLFDRVDKLKDKKIVYLICEHKSIMKERVVYLYMRNIISDIMYEKLYDMAVIVEDIAQVLLLLCIKYRMTSNTKYEEKLRLQILKLKNSDEKFIKNFIEALTVK